MEHRVVARAESPRGEIVLRERRDPQAAPDERGVLELRVNGVYVMDDHETATERALATTVLRQVERPRDVVVAGLGLGFTMHEVLADHRVERLAVVEIEDELVRWMRDGTIPHGPTFLADERVRVLVADIRMAIAEATPARYDLVLIDVDNGPEALVYEDNADIYRPVFLTQVLDCLRPGGALAVWSAAESPALREALEDVFDNAVSIPLDVILQDRDEQYWLYLARREA